MAEAVVAELVGGALLEVGVSHVAVWGLLEPEAGSTALIEAAETQAVERGQVGEVEGEILNHRAGGGQRKTRTRMAQG